MVERSEVYNVLGVITEGKRQFGRSRLRWVDNIKTDLHEFVFRVIDWIKLAQDMNT
jgi:hypothetical protein